MNVVLSLYKLLEPSWFWAFYISIHYVFFSSSRLVKSRISSDESRSFVGPDKPDGIPFF